MSTRTIAGVSLRRPPSTDLSHGRLAALAGIGFTTIASLTVLYRITSQLGGTLQLALHSAVAIVLAVLIARYLTPRAALWVFALIATVSYFWYFAIVVEDLMLLIEAPQLVVAHTINDAMAIATGQSVLGIVATDVWAHSFAPAPLFLTWYFAVRRQYVTAGAIGGAVMLLFVLSGDLGMWATLLGTIGVVMCVGFGTIELTGASRRYAEGLLVLIAVMVAVALLIPLVPSGGALGPVSVIDSLDSKDHQTLESSVVGSGDSLEIIGEINLDPGIRFAVTGEQPTYLRTGVYDTYTGSGWERSGESSSFSRVDIEDLPPNVMMFEQNITALVDSERVPSSGTALDIRGISHFRLERTAYDSVIAPEGLESGEWYRAITAVPLQPPSGGTLTAQEADDRFLHLPDDVPDELHSLTADLVEGADGPHEKAERIVSFLRNEKQYSHDVSVPQGDIAAGFLFDMGAGYCTYFATTAAVMLRSADVPARLAVGYTSGQQIDDDTSVVRGMNSHAWVEVYIDGYGWVQYEPTPPGLLEDVRGEILDTAREEEIDGIDTDESAELPHDYVPPEEDNHTESGNITDPNGDDPDGNVSNRTDPNGIGDDPFGPDPGGDTGGEFEYPDLSEFRPEPPAGEDQATDAWMTRDQLLAIAALMVGVIMGIRRTAIPGQTRRALKMRWHLRQGDPVADLTRSADRLEWAMTRRFRPRQPGETLRSYHRRYQVIHRDQPVDALFDAVERSRYAGYVDPDLSSAAIELADRVVDDTVVFGGRLRPTVPKGPGTLVDRIL